MPEATCPPKGRKGAPAVTPDGRYFVVRGRLWRCTNPALPADERAALVGRLMELRRRLRRSAQTTQQERRADRQALHATKVALGERGPPWWGGTAPLYDRTLAVNSPYRDWYLALCPPP